MSDLKAELIKIVIDKGLIGLLILLLGFVLSKAIERYKAKNIYYQKISEAKILAYQTVARALTVELLTLRRLHVKVFKQIKGVPEPQLIEVLQKAYEEHVNSFEERGI